MAGTVAAFLAALPAKPDDADNPIKYVCGGPMPPDPEGFKKRFDIAHIDTGFSMTDVATPLVSFDYAPPGSCGAVKTGVSVRLVDENDLPVPTGNPER